jgi:RNA polymerase sigma factor (sigma-70 family)
VQAQGKSLSQRRGSGVQGGVGSAQDGPLVAGLRRGDAASFEVVYQRYRGPLYGFLRRAVRRDDVAEDLFQETWMALARAAPALREDTDLAAWLFTVARNGFRSHLRWARLDLSRWIALTDDICPTSAPGPEVATSQARLVAAVEEALARLPAAHREVLLLVAVEGLEQSQVAEVLGISYAALRQRLTRARAALAELLPEGGAGSSAKEHAYG